MMKSTGVVKVDELGRIVIPIELRRTMGIEEKDALEIYVDNERSSCVNMNQLAFSAAMPKMFSIIKAKTFAEAVSLS